MAIGTLKAGTNSQDVTASTGTDVADTVNYLYEKEVWIEQFGAKAEIGFDNSTAILAALAHASTSGVGQVKSTAGVYELSPITLPSNVALVGPEFNALDVQHMAVTPDDETGAFVLKAVSDSSGLLISCDNTSKSSGLKNVIIDAAKHTGDVVTFDGGGSEVRHNNYLKNVLIWKGTGKQLHMTADNNGSLIESVFCRGGLDLADATSEYGIYDESQDSKIYRAFAAFCTERCIYDNAGSGRRENVDAWGCQKIGAEIADSATYYRLQTDGCGLNGLKISSAKNAVITTYKSVNNNQDNTTVLGDVEVFGDCSGTMITSAQMLGTEIGTIDNAFYQDSASATPVTLDGAYIASGYTSVFNDDAEAYWCIKDVKVTKIPYRGLESNQVNPNISFGSYTGSAPTGWVARNSGVATLENSDLPFSHLSGALITSSASGTSGVMFTSTVVDDVRNSRVKIKGLFKGSGSTYLGNQRLQIFDGVTNPFVNIPNDELWGEVALIYNVPDAATNFQVRLVAGNDTTSGLELLATNVTIDIY